MSTKEFQEYDIDYEMILKYYSIDDVKERF